MLRIDTLFCALFALLAAARGALQDLPVRAREATAPPREIVREEFFVLELGDSPPRVVGHAAWRRRIEEHGEQVEWDLRFADPGFARENTRVLHVERLGAQHGNLVWREWRPGSGRTLEVAWSPDGRGLDCIEWGRAQAIRTRLDAPDGAVMPLYWLELARRGDVESGNFQLFDPLSRTLEHVCAKTVYAARQITAPRGQVEQPVQLERTIDLVRDDGTRAGAYTFCGDELVRFRWQDGALTARRIEPGEYHAALAGTEEIAPLETVRAR